MNKPHSEPGFLIRDSIANILRIGSLIAIAVGLFALASGGSMVYLNLTAQLELERADRAATQQADRIAAELSEIQTSLRDASVVDAARSGSDDAVRSALRQREVVSILDARVLPASIDDIAVGEEIDLDFAATEMVIEAIRDGPSRIRVLQPGTPSESLAFAQKMPGDSGILLLRLTVSVVTSLLHNDDLLDFVTLAQRTDRGQTVLGVEGRSAAAPIREIPISGSSLVLQWSRAVFSAPLGNRSAIILACSGIIVLMIGMLLRRRTRLARYLERPAQRAQAETVAGPRRPSGAQSGPGSRGRRPAPKTLVLDPEETGHRSQTAAGPEDDEAPTVVARSPDLPEWLRDDADAGLDDAGTGADELGSTQPMPDEAFGAGSDEDDELLEEFDTYQGVDPSLFKPDGIYGRAGQELAVPDMVVLGQAVGSEAVEQGLRRICIAHDGRASGPELMSGLAQGLSVCGIDVIELGAVPAPVVWFAAMRMQQAGGVVVTGGNRAEDINGLEIVFDGLWLGREERRSLLDRIRNQEFTTGAGERSTADEAAAYCEQLSANQRLQRPLRLVLDCGNAVNGAMAPGLFESLGADVIPLNADAETLAAQVADFDSDARGQDLKLCVDNFAADLGIAFDRNGARLRVAGPAGRVLDPAELAALLADDLAHGGESVSVLADESLAGRLEGSGRFEVLSFDGDVRELQRSLRERGAALAIHADGTVCVAGDWHGLPDAMHAAAWLLSVLAADERPVAEILASGQEGAGDAPTPG